MKRITLFVLIMALFCMSAIGSAQTETEAPIVYISYFDGVNNPQLTSEFFDMLSTALNESGIRIEIVELSSGLSAIHVLFRPVSSRQDSIADRIAYIITLNHNPLLELSPILIPILRDNAVIFNAPKEIAVKITQGLVYIENDRCDLATDLFTTIQTETTESALQSHFPFFLGVCALLDGDYGLAETIYASILTDNLTGTYYTSTPINLAWIYIQTDRADEGIALVDDLLANYPYWSLDRHDTLARRAQLQAELDNFDAAIADIDSALQTRPNDFNLHVVRGRINQRFEQNDQALRDYTNAVTFNPNFAPAYYYRGMLYLQLGNTNNARADFDTYLKIAPGGDFAESCKTQLSSISA
jgi:tetratricopeptide (TPR) repeat protein